MQSNDAILIAILVVLVIIIVFQGGGWMKGRGGHRHDGFAAHCDSRDGCPPCNQQYPCGINNPYTVLNQQLDEIRGYRNDGYNQPPFYRHPRGLDRYHRAGAHIKPEDIAEVERDKWYAGLDACGTGQFNTEAVHDASADTMQYHCASPAIDYGSFITDLVSDPRTRDNHRRWVEEMKPWSGTAMKVDDLDVEPTIDFIGLRRPQAVVQYNPLQLTEIDTYDLASNKRFDFQG
jgi:hypothetical protein